MSTHQTRREFRDALQPVVTTLRQARKNHGFTQLALAKAVGVHQSQISEWESGQTSPNLSFLAKWANHLGYEMFMKVVQERVHITLKNLQGGEDVGQEVDQ